MRYAPHLSALLVGLSLVTGCTATVSGDGGGGYANAGTSSESSGGRTGSSGSSSGGSSGPAAPMPPSGNPKPVGAGILTAGVWDDNLNFARYLTIGSLSSFMFTEAEHVSARDAALLPAQAKSKLDITLLLDTTGSMGDEINYLKAEFSSIHGKIVQAYPNAAPRWSLVLYRDKGDAYLTQQSAFTTDPTAFKALLDAVGADGGGDYPEAVKEGLDMAVSRDWRPDADAAKLVFWVSDAPSHETPNDAVKLAQTKGLHIYPVAASGVDKTAEVLMRETAQMTGGRYIFLTNDSRVGNDHIEPSIPCYFVTTLDKAILRMVDIELTGIYREPAEEDILRKGGNPQSRICKSDSGDMTIY